MRLRFTISVLLCFLAVSVMAQRQSEFTQAEQQQISVATPGLFVRSDAFNIDFSILRADEYCFPLPVGKAHIVRGQALEISTTKGDAVKAMFEGIVRLSRKIVGYGNVVVVRHRNGLETVYAQNAQNLVKVGDKVKAGQTIAIVGGTDGRVYLQFAMMVNGGWINPATILDVDSHHLLKQTIQCRRSGRHVTVNVVGTPAKKSQKHSTLDPDMAGEDPWTKSMTFKLDLAGIEKEHWAYPLPGAKVISPYGRRGRRSHSGVDLKTKPNDKIYAAFDGVVERSSPYAGYGNYIIIRHAYGFTTCYSHQSRNLVKVGQKVKAGECIGLTGRTGRATTEHLHFEVRFKGRTIDPALLFDHANNQLKARTLTLGKNGSVR